MAEGRSRRARHGARTQGHAADAAGDGCVGAGGRGGAGREGAGGEEAAGGGPAGGRTGPGADRTVAGEGRIRREEGARTLQEEAGCILGTVLAADCTRVTVGTVEAGSCNPLGEAGRSQLRGLNMQEHSLD